MFSGQGAFHQSWRRRALCSWALSTHEVLLHPTGCAWRAPAPCPVRGSALACHPRIPSGPSVPPGAQGARLKTRKENKGAAVGRLCSRRRFLPLLALGGGSKAPGRIRSVGLKLVHSRLGCVWAAEPLGLAIRPSPRSPPGLHQPPPRARSRLHFFLLQTGAVILLPPVWLALRRVPPHPRAQVLSHF